MCYPMCFLPSYNKASLYLSQSTNLHVHTLYPHSGDLRRDFSHVHTQPTPNTMSEEQEQRASSPPPPPLETDFAGAVRLADYCAESPQSWFRNINSTFAASRVTRSATKFHWAVSKLPVSLMDTIGHICDNPSVYLDPYQELQNILLESYGLSAAQKTSHLLDHPGQGTNKPSVLMDQLLAMKPNSLEDAIRVLFFRKVHNCIRDGVNPNNYKNLGDLTKRCNEVWESRSASSMASASVAAAAVPRSASPARSSRRNSSLFLGKRPALAKSHRRRSPTPAAARGTQDGGQEGLCFYHARFHARARKCEEPCTYQENE